MKVVTGIPVLGKLAGFRSHPYHIFVNWRILSHQVFKLRSHATSKTLCSNVHDDLKT